MRKGRSQRKTRGSLPPLSSTRPPHAVPMGAGGPQVVIGLTTPRSEDASFDAGRPETRETLAMRDVEALELVREKNLEIVRESLELVRETLANESLANEAAEAQSTDSTESTEPIESVEAVASDPVESSDPIESTEPRDFDLVESEPILTLPTLGALPTPDEISIPPVGDLAVEPVAERFFSEGELAPSGDDDEGWDETADKAQRKSAPEVVQRRARLAKYVRWAVGGAAILCVAALTRTAIVGRSVAVRASAPAVAAVAALEAPAPKAASVAVSEPAKTALPEPVVAVAPVAVVEPAAEAPRVDVPPAVVAPVVAPVVATGETSAGE